MRSLASTTHVNTLKLSSISTPYYLIRKKIIYTQRYTLPSSLRLMIGTTCTKAYVLGHLKVVCFNLEFNQMQDQLYCSRSLLYVYKEKFASSSIDYVLMTRGNDEVMDERRHMECPDEVEYSKDEHEMMF